MQILLIFALIFALGVAIFAVQNATPVEIGFLMYQGEISLVYVILLSVLAGALIVFLLSIFKQITLYRRIRALDKKNQSLEQELHNLAPKETVPAQSTEAPSQEYHSVEQ
ncbi:LapA family protein [Dehalobacterium formicoaceticum]|uniref:LapA family protein n=1 Tax=Dehalobacterium formicoaceticum TaxID=51515 RepID=A0ABT1Y7E0_9FIRM|nr:LapA family protein [Dehalobacterium formicoaceticum]MCR6546799.1 LapA family protein [Dehalobacterium formicoaceticum]